MLKMMHIEKNLHNLEFHLILWLLKQTVILELKEKIDFIFFVPRNNQKQEYHLLLTCPIYRKNRNECFIKWSNIRL